MDTMLPMDTVLSNDLLQAFAKRVGSYDRENRFFKEDFEDLRKAGYLTMNIPKELGGQGLSLAEVCKRQRRLAYHAPATALGVNMHVYWVGVAADLWRAGDKSLEWILTEAAAGEVFAAGHAERGNDLPLLLSTAKAERVAGGFKLSGHKMFGSLAPVWTRYGVHALWADADGGPKIVHAFMPRSTKDYRIVETWDTLGMRGTASHSVKLENVFVADAAIAARRPAGVWHPSFHLISMIAFPLVYAVYTGVAEAGRDIAVAAAAKRKQPETVDAVGQLETELAATLIAHRSMVDFAEQAQPGPETTNKVFQHRALVARSAVKTVELALVAAGGAGFFKSMRLERAFRDVQGARFHPLTDGQQQKLAGRMALGLPIDG